MNHLRLGLGLISLAVCGGAMAVGPTSTLYLTNYGEYNSGNEVGLDRIQGAGFASSSTGNFIDICIAVGGGDVRTTGYSPTYAGSRFDLAGNPLPGGPYTNLIGNQLHDGTTDGVYNYAADYVTGDVIEFDRNWANGVTLFNPSGPNGTAYITMNAGDGSFWLSMYGGSDLVEHRTHSGALISSFNSGVFNTAGLALDPVDGTLWMSEFNGGHTLYQFTQGGSLLQTMNYNLQGTWYGMEFNTTPTPEPASMAALGIGVLAALRRRSRA